MKRFGALLLTMLWPVAAHACPVCFAANDRNRAAFLGTTIMLSLLPLGMLAAGAIWFAKRAGLRLDEEFSDRDATLSPLTNPAAQS